MMIAVTSTPGRRRGDFLLSHDRLPPMKGGAARVYRPSSVQLFVYLCTLSGIEDTKCVHFQE